MAVAVALLVLGACFAGLGTWQLDRAEENRARVDRFDAADALPELAGPVESLDESRYRKLSLDGSYLPEPQILLDNRVLNGIVGYEVLTAFAARGHERLIVVNRGWLPARERRDLLPDVSIDGSSRSISGRVDALPRVALDLEGEEREPDRAVHVMSYPSYGDIEAVLGREVYPFQLLLDGSVAGAYATDWRPPGEGGTRNLVYAGQWFLLSALAVGAGLVVFLKPLFDRARARRGPYAKMDR